ncbi:MAG: hypothetical protein KA188_09160 [Leadbetterella sp.]|nr:hypothetical protein [Leadbetterella sp.]
MKYLLLLLLSSLTSYSQLQFNPNFLRLDLVGIKMNIEEIIDVRTQQELTFIQSDSVLKLETSAPLNLLIKNFINYSLPQNNKKNQITIKLNEFQFGSRQTEGKPIVWLYSDLEFFLKSTEGYAKVMQISNCQEIAASDNLYLTMNNLNWKFWNSTLNDLEKNLRNLDNKVPITSKFIETDVQLNNILIDKIPKDGIYPTYKKFKANDALQCNFEIPEILGQIHLKIENNQLMDSISKIWGVCQNGKLYKAIKNEKDSSYFLLPLTKFLNTFEVETVYSNNEIDPNSISGNTKIPKIVDWAFVAFDIVSYVKFKLPISSSLIQLGTKKTPININQRFMIDKYKGSLKPIGIYEN